MVPPTAGATVAAPQRASKPWIESAWRDLAFYIATPVLLVPLILLQPERPNLQEWILYVGAFGALGHHLPGMMRAYGDRELFTRFRVRFLVAPVFLISVCVFFTVRDLGGVILITFFWTTWHTLMQIFGFARIYDAKVGSTGRWTSRLDQALCLVWIGAPILLSDSRLGSVLELWYKVGGPLIPASLISALTTTWLAAIVIVSLAWLTHTGLAWSHGQAPNPAKLALFGSSFLFWWLCMASIDHLLVGVRLFDIFHDVQYLALVWVFNKARVARDANVGGFSRFLFRGRMSLAGVYVGMVVAYGSLGYFSESISGDVIRRSLLGVLAASALLHFYFDGFIWKVRERSTRTALNLEGGQRDLRPGGSLPAWSLHGAKWLVFLVPLCTLYWWEVHDTRPEREWREAIVAAVPGSAEALTNLGKLIDPRQEQEQALALNRRAIERKPAHPPAHNNLGVALYRAGRTDEAKASFLEAIRLQPKYAIAHRHLAALLTTSGESDLAAEHFRTAIDLDPQDGSASAGLASILDARGETRGAIVLYEQALEREPTELTALNGLAWIHATHPDTSLRNGARAVELAQTLVKLTGREVPLTLATLAAAYAEVGRFGEAVEVLADSIALARRQGQPDLASAFETHMRRYERGEALRSAD